MDKAIIIGTYEFLGFNICQQILNEGIEVEGIHADFNSNDLFVEEKRFEIGRNSNFVETNYDDWKNGNRVDESTVVVDFYDFFIRNVEKQLLSDIKFQHKLLNLKGKVIFLLPVQIVRNRQFKGIHSRFVEIIDRMKKDERDFQAFYLPTIYGPWQPANFIYQQSFLKEKHECELSDREYSFDAIYVDSAVHSILQFSKENHQDILLKNHEESWFEGLQLLDLTNIEIREKDPQWKFHGVEKVINDSVSLQTGLTNQRKKVETLEFMRKWE